MGSPGMVMTYILNFHFKHMNQREFIRIGNRTINLNLIRQINFSKDDLSISLHIANDEVVSFDFVTEPDYLRFETFINMYSTRFDGVVEKMKPLEGSSEKQGA